MRGEYDEGGDYDYRAFSLVSELHVAPWSHKTSYRNRPARIKTSTKQRVHRSTSSQYGEEEGGGGGCLTSKAFSALAFPLAIIVPKKYSFERAFDCDLSVFRAAITSSFTACASGGSAATPHGKVRGAREGDKNASNNRNDSASNSNSDSNSNANNK